MVQMKEQIKAPKTELSNEETAHAEAKTLVISMLTEMVEYGKSDGYEKWNKEKYSGIQQWREGNKDSNQQYGPEGRNKHLTRTEWRNKNSKN